MVPLVPCAANKYNAHILVNTCDMTQGSLDMYAILNQLLGWGRRERPCSAVQVYELLVKGVTHSLGQNMHDWQHY